jgi:hypothetical protein
MTELPPELRKYRKSRERHIGLLRIFFYAATAASFAAGASDAVDGDLGSALGNFGILLILGRLYLLSPLLVARSSVGDDKWVDAEADWAEDRYPWLDTLGNAGWALLGLGVVLQLLFGA